MIISKCRCCGWGCCGCWRSRSSWCHPSFMKIQKKNIFQSTCLIRIHMGKYLSIRWRNTIVNNNLAPFYSFFGLFPGIRESNLLKLLGSIAVPINLPSKRQQRIVQTSLRHNLKDSSELNKNRIQCSTLPEISNLLRLQLKALHKHARKHKRAKA